MKKTLIFITLCLLSTSLWAQQNPLERFFDKYSPDTSFTIINISPKMFNLFSKVNLNTGDPQAQQVLSVAQKLTGLQIITKDHARNGMQLFREASGMLPRKYEELMTIRDHGNDVKFMINQGTDGIIHNLIMLVAGGNEFFAMSLTGNIDLNEISKIAGDMNIQGFDKLKDIKQPKK
jgi:hypothetical protein